MPAVVTISARYDWFIERQSTPFHYVIGISGILSYNQESYLTNMSLDHPRIFLPAPPRQPRVFARLAHWQLTTPHINQPHVLLL